MNYSAQIAKHFKDVHYGGNWTDVNLKDTLANVTWQQATTKVQSLNTIAGLVYHLNYYTTVCINILQEIPMDAHDKYSWETPPILNQQDWEKLVAKLFADADILVTLIEQLPESKLEEIFMKGKEQYGDYYKNLHGTIEHAHYHLGQMVLIKKLLSQ